MIGVRAGVDDETHRLGGKLANLRENRFAQLRRSRVHQQHAVMARVLAHLNGDVAKRAGEHIDVALHMAHFILDSTGLVQLLRRSERKRHK